MVGQLCSVSRERRPGPNCDRKPGGARERLRLAPGLAEGGRSTPPEVGLSRQQRRQNVPGGFTLVEPDAVAGGEVLPVVLLIDDVFTSAATVPEGARILRRTGASRASAAAAAPTLNRNAAHLQQAGRSMPG
jgi:hypothetical protein